MTTGTAVATRNELVTAIENRAEEFAASLPANIPTPRFVRIVKDALNNNPDLRKCDPASVVAACQKAASLGLVVDGQEAALVPYGRQATFIPMVKGLRKLVWNTGLVSTLDTGIVYQKEVEQDRFTYERGTGGFLRHVPLMLDDLGPKVAVYSIVKMRDGGVSVEVMRWAEVMKIAKRRGGNLSPIWRSDEEEMARKTVFRRHAKSLPFSSNVEAAFEQMDALYTDESGETQPGEIAPPAGTKTRGAAAAKLAQATAQDDPPHDRETGEILDADHTPVENETPADDEPVF